MFFFVLIFFPLRLLALARQCSSLEALVVDGLAVAAQALVAMFMGRGDTLSARRICRRC